MVPVIPYKIEEKNTLELRSEFLKECSKYRPLKVTSNYDDKGSDRTSHYYDISEVLNAKDDKIILSFSEKARLDHDDCLHESKKEDLESVLQKYSTVKDLMELDFNYVTINQSKEKPKKLTRDLNSEEALELMSFFSYVDAKEYIFNKNNVIVNEDIKKELIDYGVPEFFVECAMNAFYGNTPCTQLSLMRKKTKEELRKEYKNIGLNYDKLLDEATKTQRGIIFNENEEGDLDETDLPLIE